MFRLAQISDTHLSDDKTFFVENFRAVAASLHDAKPDLIISTGDLSLNGADLVEDLRAARRMHDEIGIAYRAIPGNHDIGDNRESAHSQPIDDERLARWHSVFPEDRFVVDVPGWRVLAINSLIIGSDLEAEAAQEAFIRAAVADLGGRSLLLALHKPLFEHGEADDEITGHFVNPKPRRRLLAALGGVAPRLVLNGHLHEYRERTVDGTRHVWAPGTSFVVPDWMFADYGGDRTVGYVEALLMPDGTFETRLVRVPGTVAHDLGDIPGAYGDLRARLQNAENAASEAAE